MKKTQHQAIVLEKKTINITHDINFLIQDVPIPIRKEVVDSAKDIGNPGHIDFINQKIKEYPNIGYFHKMRVDEYSRLGKDELHEKCTKEYFEKFPDDFFAKLNMARVYLTHDDYKGVFSIYGRNISMLSAFPDREQFHYAEVADFLYFVVRYGLSITDFNGVENAKEKLRTLRPDDDDLIAHIDEMIQYHKTELAKPHDVTLELNDTTVTLHNAVITVDDTVTLTYNYKDVYPLLNMSSEEIEILDDYRNRFFDIEAPSENFVVELQLLAEKYPQNPYFKLFVVDYYAKIRYREAFVESIGILHNAHPDFLMGKLEMAQLLLTATSKDKSEIELVDAAVKLLDDNLELQHVKPYRKLYHFDDALMFYFVVLQIHLKYNKVNLALNSLKMIKHIREDSREYFFGLKLIEDYNKGLTFNNYN